MIKFDSIVEILKTLKDVEIINRREDKDSVTFEKGEIRFILSRPIRENKAIQSDFAITIAVQPKEIRENKLNYLSILELVNEMNQSQGNLCTYYYSKKYKMILIDISHILFGQENKLCDDFFEQNLKDYLPMAILSMLVLLYESVANLNIEITAQSENSLEDKNEENE